MNLAALFIKKPVSATMLTLFLVVLGLMSYRSLGVDLFPNVDFPVAVVMTSLKGASPEEMEAQVTKPIEEAVNTASGIDELRSVTYEGMSLVTVAFLLERNTAEAVQDVRDKVSRVVAQLPADTDPPVILRFDTGSIPVATLVVSGDMSLKELTEFTDKVVKQDIETINGVGQASLVGGQRRAINVTLDASKLAAYRISVAQIKAALMAQNVEIPTGRIDREASEQVLRTMARVETVAEFNQLVVATVNDAPITLGDLGQAEDSTEEPRSLSRYDGRNAVAVVVQKQSGTNTVQVVDAVRARMQQLQVRVPPGVRVEPVRDLSVFIRHSIGEVKLHLVLGGVLASVVVLLFMGSLRSTVIASVAIPTSLIATFAVMRLLGFTLNNMTLLGLTLAVGIVIDDAIVVLENIYRHIDDLGKTPMQAALDGTREIMPAVTATTSSLVVIFLPIAFMSGQVGRFFNSFGITVAVAIGMSWVIAIVLTPMLCAVFLHKGASGGHKASDSWLNRALHQGYGALVRLSLRHRWKVVAVAVVCVAMVVPLAKVVKKNFLPQDDRAEFNVSVQTPPGSSLQRSSDIMHELEQRIEALPNVAHILTMIGDSGNGNGDVTQANLHVGMVPAEDRTDRTDQFAVMRQLRHTLLDYPELRTSVAPVNDMGGGGGAANYEFNYSIQGPDLDKLEQLAAHVTARMRTIKGFVDVDTTMAQRKPEVRLRIDRRKAADLHVQAADIAGSLRTLVAGEQISKYREGADQYDVWLRLRREDRASEAALYQLNIPAQDGSLAQLANLVSLSDDTGPAQIDRLNRQRQITLVANLDGLDLNGAMETVQAFIDEADMPPGYSSAPMGRAKVFAQTGQNFAIAFLLSLVFMYMILAAQFESFLHPVTIMLSLPLSIPFGLLSLVVLQDSINLYSIIGVFMLFGIVKKNGILQVDYTNTLREEGMARDAAIIEANLVRLRPILMTTITLIAGMIPIALGQGPGAASRASMAKVIIGGQAMSLLITLLIVPVAYSLFDDATRFFRSRFFVGLQQRRVWALSFASGGACMAVWLLVQVSRVLADLPGPVLLGAKVLGAAGLLLVTLGVILQSFDSAPQPLPNPASPS